SLRSAGQDLSPVPPPVTRTIPSERPELISLGTAAQAVSAARTAGGFNVNVTGFSTARQITLGIFQFGGSNLDSKSLNVDLAAIFSSWYQSQASIAFGSEFT